MLRQPTVRSPVAAIIGVIIVAIAGFAAGILTTILAAIGLELVGVTVFDDLVVAIVVSVVGQGFGFGIVALGYLQFRNIGIDYLRLRVPTLRDFGWMVGGLVIMFVALIGLNILIGILDIPEPADHIIAELGRESPELLLVLIPLSFLVIGPGEEILFRGVIQTRLVEEFGIGVGIVLTSIIFALAHLAAFGGEGIAIALTVLFFLSLILGAIYEYSGNLVVPAVIHGTYNAILFLGLYATLV